VQLLLLRADGAPQGCNYGRKTRDHVAEEESLKAAMKLWQAADEPGPDRRRRRTEPSWGCWRLLALETRTELCRQIMELEGQRAGATRMRRSGLR
jgi:hypothetical protein